jgi:hypothetical protein
LPSRRFPERVGRHRVSAEETGSVPLHDLSLLFFAELFA